jgi:transposase-like protein
LCGSIHIKKNGISDRVGQRYYCKECHKSFSAATKAFSFHSKVSDRQWIQFIDYEIAKLPLREESYFLGLSITTCYFMRHKLYRAVSDLQLKEKMEKTTQLDSSYFKLNLKGTKPHNMTRISKKRGGGSAYSGVSHHKICVVTAIDENDHSLA